MSSENYGEISILLIEDNEGDIRLAKEALSESKIDNDLKVIKSGEKALEYLFENQNGTDFKRPDLILLDLNLPKVHGSVILQRIKSDPELKTIPVVVLTTSEEKSDVINSYSSHANSFITKPLNWQDFIDMIKSLESFWFSIVKLPAKNVK